MRTILLAARKWSKGESFWFQIISINPVCYSPWWVMATIKKIIKPEFVDEFYRNFWRMRLK